MSGGSSPGRTRLFNRRRHFYLVIVNAAAAFHFVGWYDHAPFEDRAALYLLAYFVTESGSNGFGQHVERGRSGPSLSIAS